MKNIRQKELLKTNRLTHAEIFKVGKYLESNAKDLTGKNSVDIADKVTKNVHLIVHPKQIEKMVLDFGLNIDIVKRNKQSSVGSEDIKTLAGAVLAIIHSSSVAVSDELINELSRLSARG